MYIYVRTCIFQNQVYIEIRDYSNSEFASIILSNIRRYLKPTNCANHCNTIIIIIIHDIISVIA